MSYVVQTKEGPELNRVYEEDLSIHDWYRFVLSYPPHLVKNYLSRFGIDDRHRVLDPFCGTGTTLVECKKQGVSSVGIEANPVVHFMASTKLSWDVSPDRLVSHAEAIARETGARLFEYGLNFKTLSEEQEALIIEGSMSPMPLHKSLVLLETINEFDDPIFSKYEKVAFAKQLVYSFSNLKFGPEVGVSKKKKQDVDVVGVWLNQVRKIAADLRQVDRFNTPNALVHLGDARLAGEVLENQSIDFIVTSPPYPNEKDYSRTTRLESVLLGFMSTKQDLRAHKERFIRSNTRNVYVSDIDEKWVENNERVLSLADSIEKKRIELGKTSGFEKLYHRVVRLYFGGMARHLEELKSKLRPGATLVYVVGDQASYFRVLIQTGEILADIAKQAGYEVLGIDLFRTRLATATKDYLREEAVLLRWNG